MTTITTPSLETALSAPTPIVSSKPVVLSAPEARAVLAERSQPLGRSDSK